MNDMTIKKWKFNYDRVRREFWQTLAALVGIVLLIVVVATSGSGKKGDAAPSDTTTAAYSDNAPDFFDAALAEYSELTGRTIYPKGREFLLNAAIKSGLRTKEQVLKLIRENEKYMWKNNP